MDASILDSTKKILGIEADYTAFDVDILTHINSVFATLHQIGIGPEEGFYISDATPTWSAFLDGDPRLNSVRTYMYMRVRLLFDPPGTSFLVDALNNQIRELEWRLNTYREQVEWTEPEEGGMDGNH